MIIAENQRFRPNSTTNAYSSKQKEWKAWCLEIKEFADGVVVTDEKLSWFLNDYVIPRGRKNKKKDDNTKYELGKESILSYVKAIVSLYNEQSALGINRHPHPRGKLVRAFLDTHAKKVTQKKRDNYEDRGKNTLNDGYTGKEMVDINRYFLEKGTVVSTRDRLVFLMSHAMLLRSQNAVGMQLPDLFSMELEDLGLSQCVAIVANIYWGKTNNAGKTEYGSAIRHKNCELCPVNAFAMYLFSLYHHENVPFPNFNTRRDWYDTYLFPSPRNNEGHIIYKDQYASYKKVFEACGISTSKITHATRKSSIQMIYHKGVPSDQLRQVGRWNSDRMVSSYLTGLPVKAVKVLAGFSVRDGDYFINRAAIDPPQDLKKQIFPQVEEWQEKFYRKEVQEDISGPNFLKMLDFLRTVLLQDSVILKQKYPDHYLWTNPIFTTTEYKSFQEQLLATVNKNDQQLSMSQHLEVLLPEVTAAMKTGFSSIITSITAMQAQAQSSYKRIEESEASTRNLIADSFMQVAANIASPQQPRMLDGSQGSSMLTATPPSALIPSCTGNEVTVQSTSSTLLVQYKMNRNLVKATDVWREYAVGLSGCPAIKSLEENHGTNWRKNRTESKFFCTRSVLYKEIQKISERDCISAEEAAEKLERRRIELKVSIDKLIKLIKSSNE